MPDQPRRILEKSKTVRRRYQKSNKRFQFTESQIQKIEREQEREKNAQRLRDREKKRIANKKKTAEKEAKEREERKRLGLADPNAPKLPSSQPLLLKFFGKKNETQQARHQKSIEECGQSDSTRSEGSDVETEYGDHSFDDILDEDHTCDKDAHGNDTVSVCGSGEPTASKIDADQASRKPDVGKSVTKSPSTRAHDSVIGLVSSLGDSFEDETSILLQDVDPDLFLQPTTLAQSPNILRRALVVRTALLPRAR
jgi:hypothetical protein